MQVYVGGSTAAFIDISDRIATRLPWFIGVVIGLSFLLLMIVFRSILVPLKAAVMNVLSIGAAYGVIVAVFQWGWFRGVFGVEQSLPDRELHPDDDVRHPLRALDGLRGVPALTRAGGVAAHRRRTRERARPGSRPPHGSSRRPRSS